MYACTSFSQHDLNIHSKNEVFFSALMQSHGIHNWWRMTWKQFARRSLHCVSCAEGLSKCWKIESTDALNLVGKRKRWAHRSGFDSCCQSVFILPIALSLSNWTWIFWSFFAAFHFLYCHHPRKVVEEVSGIKSFADSRGTLLEEWAYRVEQKKPC